MKALPIVPAQVEGIDTGRPFSPEYQDLYHPHAGALTQARHVFLRGNELPARWQRRERFVVLETGFGLGNNFLATWDVWRNDTERCARLCFISIEQRPLTRADLARVHADSPLRHLAELLLNDWPALTPNLHCLSFEGARVQLLLALGDVSAWLPELVASVDAFYLDGFAPAKNPRMWDERVCKALGRLAAPGATLSTWTAAHAVRAGLTTAGFEVRLAAGIGGKRDITLAHFAPKFQPRRAPGRYAPTVATERRALIIGGGLAGCAAAWALAEQGWHSSVFERHNGIAEEGSGNPASLFHGIVNAQDGAHARFNRAAALAAREAVHIALLHHGALGDAQGLLRLETTLDHARMQHVLAELGLPEDYVQAMRAEVASARCGVPLQHPAWYYPGGGWVQPAALAHAFLERAGTHASLRLGVDVQALHFDAGQWQALDMHGTLIDEAPTLILANAGDALRLLGAPDWPIEKVRGQISLVSVAALGPKESALRTQVPIAGTGYLLPEVNGRVMFGATAQAGDDDASVRDADHLANLTQLARLTGRAVSLDPQALEGRTAWRWTSQDRLPIIGAVPEMHPFDLASNGSHAQARRLDQPRFVPRVPGLFVFTALGSRGITWSALGGRVVAAAISGGPAPLEASLLDAIDPARFIARQARRSGAH